MTWTRNICTSIMLDQPAFAAWLLALSRGRLSAHGGYIWLIVHSGAFDTHSSQWDALMLHETTHYTDSLSSGFIFIFSLFRDGYGSLWLGLSRLYGAAKVHQTASLWAALGYCYVCCRPGCLTIFRWRLQATIFEDSLSLVLFWFYCSQSRSVHLLIPPFIQHL